MEETKESKRKEKKEETTMEIKTNYPKEQKE